MYIYLYTHGLKAMPMEYSNKLLLCIALLLTVITALQFVFLTARYFYLKSLNVKTQSKSSEHQLKDELEKALEKEDYSSVLTQTNKILDVSPSHPWGLWFRGQAKYHLKDADSALCDFEKLANCRPEWETVPMWIAHVKAFKTPLIVTTLEPNNKFPDYKFSYK